MSCQRRHCLSSRYMLSHYYNCKQDTCPVCGPVKATIRAQRLQANGQQAPQ